MRKLKGITINGEYLGNSVVVNGMFRAICTISPSIMRDFVLMLNKIDNNGEAVKINNFHCGYDSIDIEFDSENSKGSANMSFKLEDGEPILTESTFKINDDEYDCSNGQIIKRPVISNSQNPIQSDEADKARKIKELKERKLAELRKQRGLDASENQDLTVSQDAEVSTEQETPQKPVQKLSPDELREQKKRELLEKKRKAIEARKAALQKQAGSQSELISPETVSQADFTEDYDNFEQAEETEILTEKNEVVDTKFDMTDESDFVPAADEKISAKMPDEIEQTSLEDDSLAASNDVIPEESDSKQKTDKNIEDNKQSLNDIISHDDIDVSENIGDEDIVSADSDDEIELPDEGDEYDEDILAEDESLDTKPSEQKKSVSKTKDTSKDADSSDASEDFNYDDYSDLSVEELAQLEAEIESELEESALAAEKLKQKKPDIPKIDFNNDDISDEDFYSAALKSNDGKTYTIIAKSIRLEIAGADNLPQEVQNQISNNNSWNNMPQNNFPQNNSANFDNGFNNSNFNDNNLNNFNNFGNFDNNVNNVNNADNGNNENGFNFDTNTSFDFNQNNQNNQNFQANQNQYNAGPQQPWNNPYMQQPQPYPYPPPYPQPPYPYPQNPENGQNQPYPQYPQQPYPYPYPPPYPPYPYPQMPPYPPMPEGDAAQTNETQIGDVNEEGFDFGHVDEEAPMMPPPVEEDELMTLDEFQAKQKELKDYAEKKLRQKFRIVSSKDRINARALDGGVFVAGNKVYKWGDVRHLDG